MKKEPVWMQDIRQKMKKTRFYGQMDEELEQYRQEYLKILDTLDTPRENAIRQYVEQLQKCEYHHIRTAYLLGMEDEKAKQRARKNDFYRLITQNNALKTAVVIQTANYLQSTPENEKYLMEANRLGNKYHALLATLPEEQRKLAEAYQQNLADIYEIMFHIAAGFPKGML